MMFAICCFIATCPPNKPPISCPINPCDHQSCPQYPNASCTVNRCGECKAKLIVNQEDVTDQCGTLYLI